MLFEWRESVADGGGTLAKWVLESDYLGLILSGASYELWQMSFQN